MRLIHLQLRLVAGPAAALLALACGCSLERAAPPQPASSKTTETPASTASADKSEPAASSPKQPEQDSPPPEAEPPVGEPDWDRRLAAIEQVLQQQDLEEARKKLAQLGDQPPAAYRGRLNQLRQQLSEQAVAVAESLFKANQGRLKEAEKHFRAGELDPAEELTGQVLASPQLDRVQKKRADELAGLIGERRLARAQLRESAVALASHDRGEVHRAQDALFARAERAVPLLQELAAGEQLKLVPGALEMLRLLDRPQELADSAVDVVERSEQRSNWNAALEQLRLSRAAGAGEDLLQLYQSSEVVDQRIAALRGLARIVDPPRRTLAVVLPRLFEEGPELVPALEAAAHAVSTHGQLDLVSRRGLDLQSWTEEQFRQLERLPARLKRLASTEPSSPSRGRRAAALRLALSLGYTRPQKIAPVEVVAFTDEMAESPAVAVLDGHAETTDPKQMWRYDVDQRGSILFHLGGQRTVVGVRIWNLNESKAGHRGWREVEVGVGDTPAETVETVATGVLPEAPGKDDAGNYSTLVRLPFAQGRYLRLHCKSIWREDRHSGLTEVEILGF